MFVLTYVRFSCLENPPILHKHPAKSSRLTAISWTLDSETAKLSCSCYIEAADAVGGFKRLF